MRNLAILVFFQFFFIGKSFSQDSVDYNAYRNCVKSFYKLLYEKNVSVEDLSKVYANGGIRNEADLILCDSLGKKAYNYQTVKKISTKLNYATQSYVFKRIKLFETEIKQGLSLTQIENLIYHAKVYNQGDDFDYYVEIDFPNNKKIYFDMDIDTPTKIVWIWLNNGDKLEGKFSDNNPERLLFPGTINDPDGYVNIRETPSTEAKIITKFVENDYFYYIPCGDCEWWQVKKRWNTSFIGYIHKSRVKNYVNFPVELKQQVKSEINK